MLECCITGFDCTLTALFSKTHSQSTRNKRFSGSFFISFKCLVGYCTYAAPQSVRSTEKGDVVFGAGVDFVDSLIEAEAKKLGKESYTTSGKERVFFIIADKNKINDFIAFYMNSSEGNNLASDTLYSYWKTSRAKV